MWQFRRVSIKNDENIFSYILIRIFPLVSCFGTCTPPSGHLPEMHVEYSSARRSSSEEKVTFDGSGLGVCTSGVTFVPVLTPGFVGVHRSGQGGKGELTCWARFVLQKQTKKTLKLILNPNYFFNEPVYEVPTVNISILFSL